MMLALIGFNLPAQTEEDTIYGYVVDQPLDTIEIVPDSLYYVTTPDEYDKAEQAKGMVVTMTVYRPTCKGCNNITASGKRINMSDPYSHKWIAVSRDLRKLYPYGTKVEISGSNFYDGIFYVEDTMHPKWKNRIDILTSKRQPLTIGKVTIKKVD